MTDIPFRTFVGARIQIIINLNDYEIIDATPFVNTGFVDPNSGDAILRQRKILGLFLILLFPGLKMDILDFVCLFGNFLTDLIKLDLP